MLHGAVVRVCNSLIRRLPAFMRKMVIVYDVLITPQPKEPRCSTEHLTVPDAFLPAQSSTAPHIQMSVQAGGSRDIGACA